MTRRRCRSCAVLDTAAVGTSGRPVAGRRSTERGCGYHTRFQLTCGFLRNPSECELLRTSASDESVAAELLSQYDRRSSDVAAAAIESGTTGLGCRRP